jgi:hypothetical protein
MSAKKILMLVGDFVEDYEAMVWATPSARARRREIP